MLLLCARALRGLLVGSCHVHVCAHATPLANPDIPMEGLTKHQWAKSVQRITHLHSLNHCGGVPLGVPYTTVARVESSQPRGGTHMHVYACLCVVLPPGLPYTPGLFVVPWGGHPHDHLASGPLGFVPLCLYPQPKHTAQLHSNQKLENKWICLKN